MATGSVFRHQPGGLPLEADANRSLARLAAESPGGLNESDGTRRQPRSHGEADERVDEVLLEPLLQLAALISHQRASIGVNVNLNRCRRAEYHPFDSSGCSAERRRRPSVCQHHGMVASGPSFRLLPRLSDDVAFFWTAGAKTVSCASSAATTAGSRHPSARPVCPRCLSREPGTSRRQRPRQVETFSVNYQQWIPGSDPYIIAWVSIDEQPDIRLTTNLIDVEPEDVSSGWRSKSSSSTSKTSTFRSSGRYCGSPVSPNPTEEPLERRAVISGIGQSEMGPPARPRRPRPHIEASVAAIADAGLTRDDIDGLSTYPGMGIGTPGFAGPTTPEVQDALGLSLNWHDGGGEGAGQMRAVIAASLAVAAGLARHVLVYRTVTEGTAQGTGGRRASAAAVRGRSACPAWVASCSGLSPRRRLGLPTGSPWWASGACTSSELDARTVGPDRHQRPRATLRSIPRRSTPTL